MILKRDAGPAADMLVAAENLDAFEGLRQELDAEFGEGGWSVATLRALRKALDAEAPSYVMLAIDPTDLGRLDDMVQLVATARARGAAVILVMQELPPMAMHRLMRAGAEDFLPAPVPQGALRESLAALEAKHDGGDGQARNGMVYPVYGVAGGVGATTFAVNLAWEIANEARKEDIRVAILDLDFQYGSVATYLDMPRRDSVFELLTGIDRADANGFAAALEDRSRRLSVLTAPADALPLNIVSPADMEKLIGFAKASYDVVILDLPSALTEWTETCLAAAQRFWAVMEIDMRSAQNMLRFLRALQAEELPFDKVDYVMNRVPGFGDFGARGRVKKMAETLGIEYGVLLPDGGKSVIQACDHGSPLADFASSNVLRKEIRKTARAVLEEVQASRESAV